MTRWETMWRHQRQRRSRRVDVVFDGRARQIFVAQIAVKHFNFSNKIFAWKRFIQVEPQLVNAGGPNLASDTATLVLEICLDLAIIRATLKPTYYFFWAIKEARTILNGFKSRDDTPKMSAMKFWAESTDSSFWLSKINSLLHFNPRKR